MNSLPKPGVLIAGIVLILLTNVIVVIGAIGNRSGEPEAMLELTERELGLRHNYRRENSGISLRLNTVRNYRSDDTWLTMQKLSELGFKIELMEDKKLLRRYIRKQIPKNVYVVLEFDGDIYQTALKNAEDRLDAEKERMKFDSENKNNQYKLENAQRQLAWITLSATRLYSIDAGLDPDVLRQLYPDRSRYILATGLVEVRYDGRKDAPEPYYGIISNIHITSIHVPLQHRNVLDNLPTPQYGEFRFYPPRYKVRLAYGNRYEPWIISVEGI